MRLTFYCSSSGAAYVFLPSTGMFPWSEQQKLLASDGAAYDSFGVSVSVHEDVLVVGAFANDAMGADSGRERCFAEC